MFCTAVTWIMTNISVMLDFALSPANFARDSVRVQTIFTACKTVLFISAGLSMIIHIMCLCNHMSIGRNTHVPSCALPTASAK